MSPLQRAAFVDAATRSLLSLQPFPQNLYEYPRRSYSECDVCPAEILASLMARWLEPGRHLRATSRTEKVRRRYSNEFNTNSMGRRPCIYDFHPFLRGREKMGVPRRFSSRNKGFPGRSKIRRAVFSRRCASRSYALKSRRGSKGIWIIRGIRSFVIGRLHSSFRPLSFRAHSGVAGGIPRKCLMENSMKRSRKCLYILHAEEWRRERSWKKEVRFGDFYSTANLPFGLRASQSTDG